MMETLRSLVSGDEMTVVHECRRCGTTVDGENAVCPYCGPTDVVSHELT